MRTALLCVALLVAVSRPGPTYGQEPKEVDETAEDVENEADDCLDLEQIVVTAKRRGESSFLCERSLSLVDSKELNNLGPRTTPEALLEAPGVFVQQTNHGGGSPILRGMIGPQVLLMVDGVRLNNSTYRTGPLQYLNLLDPLSIDRIEVLRGPGSVLYGSDAMGGVIQIIPLAPRGLEDGRETAVGGSTLVKYSSANHGVTSHTHIDGRAGGFGALGGFTYRNFGNLVGGGDVGEQVYSGHDSWSAIGALVYDFGGGPMDGWYVKLGYLFARVNDAGRTDKLYDKNSLQFYDNDDHLLYGRLHARLAKFNTDCDLTLSFQHFFERKDNYKVGDDYAWKLSAVTDEVTALTPAGDLEITTRLWEDKLRIQLGGMWYHDAVSADRWTQSGSSARVRSDSKAYPDGSTYDNYGAFLLAEIDPLKGKGEHTLRLTGGYRLHGMSGHAPSADMLPAVDFSNTGHVFHAAAQYIYGTKATAALTFSQGYRAPNLQEAVMLGDTGKFFHIPNDNLAPERSNTIELLGRARVKKVRFGLTGYVSFLNDLIKREESDWQGETEVSGKNVWKNVNGGRGLIWGTEANLAVDVGMGFALDGSLTYTWGTEFVEGGDDVPLSRIPPLFGSLRLRYDSPRLGQWVLFGDTSVRAATTQDRLSNEDGKDVRIPEGGTPGWWTWNVRAGARFADWMRLMVVGENLLNTEYKYHGSGIYASGFNLLVTLELMQGR